MVLIYVCQSYYLEKLWETGQIRVWLYWKKQFSPKKTDFVPVLKVLSDEYIGITDLTRYKAFEILNNRPESLTHRRQFQGPLCISVVELPVNYSKLKLKQRTHGGRPSDRVTFEVGFRAYATLIKDNLFVSIPRHRRFQQDPKSSYIAYASTAFTERAVYYLIRMGSWMDNERSSPRRNTFVAYCWFPPP